MRYVDTDAGSIHIAERGPSDGRPVLFSNSLGTDLRIWDRLVSRMATGLRLIRYDKRGHGLSDCPRREMRIADHVADAAAVMDALDAKGGVIVGLSVGGMIAQGLAAERPDLVSALVLCDTGAKIGDAELWNGRIAAIEEGGIAAQADGITERWFSAAFRRERAGELALWRNMLVRTPLDGYLGTAAAIRDADLTETTRRLTAPTLALCGEEDGATTPDLVRATAALIAGAEFHLIPGCGHLPCIEAPEVMAERIAAFLDGPARA